MKDKSFKRQLCVFADKYPQEQQAEIAAKFAVRQKGIVKNMTDLTKIPGIGKNMAQHLIKAGYPDIESLKGQDPREIYDRDCAAQGFQVDRCALYCYRLAVHYADHDGSLPEKKQNWWDWKD